MTSQGLFTCRFLRFLRTLYWARAVVPDLQTVKDLLANLTTFSNDLCFLPKPKRDNKGMYSIKPLLNFLYRSLVVRASH